jgi:uncharacterized membrane protein YphA (DoxX/SURF4 family)
LVATPFSDAVKFLTLPRWTTGVYWLLLLAAAVIAGINWWADREQRSAVHIWTLVLRFLMGTMWWGQTLWKLPPGYGGLRYWTGELAKYAAFPVQRDFVKNIVEPHFAFFAPQVYFMEVFVAVTLILGLWARLGAFLGVLLAINLWLGFYHSPTEWPWTYGFLILLQITLLVYRAGRSLGVDAVWLRQHKGRPPAGARGRLVVLLS